MQAIEHAQQAKLLIVEDEGVLALDIERQLRGLGFTIVGVAASADEALRLAGLDCPDLAIVDLRIEGARDGIETALRLRADFDVPVVFLTAHGDAHTIARASATRPLGYLLKPFEHQDLQNVVSIAVARNEHERALELRERLVSTTLAAVAEAIITTDAESVITYLNPAAEELIGCSLDECLARPLLEVAELVDERSGEPLGNPVARAIEHRAREEFSGAVLKARDGTLRQVVGTAAPLSSVGAPKGAVLVLRDLTEVLSMRRQLEFVDRLAALGTLAAGVAHEINNPLSFLASNLDYALEHARQATGRELPFDADWPDVVSALSEAREGARRVTQIVADLRALSRRPVEGLRLLDPREAVRFALAVTAHEWKTHARLQLALGAAPDVLADETRLGQVLVNLIINAAHAMHGTSDNTLTLATLTNGAGEALIEVRDTGSGMTAAVRAKAFEPFFTTKGGSGLGTGLGLPVSLSIVTRFGGRMEIEASPPRGTVFRVILPGGGSAARLAGVPPLA
jgi:PAS domain S-box-containing protein